MRPVIHRAGWLMMEPGVWQADAGVLAADGRVAASGDYHTVASRAQGAEIIDHGPGALLARPVNAHTHLSLSVLAGLQTNGGFMDWVARLVRERERVTPDQARRAAVTAARYMVDSGTGYCVEIGSPDPAVEAMRAAGLPGLAMPELLGSAVAVPDVPDNDALLSHSVAGHAPQTSSPDLLQAVKAADEAAGRMMSIHLAESEAEMEFLATGRGPAAELLTARGIEFRPWGPWGEHPVERAQRLGLLGGRTLAVHLIHTGPREWDILARTGTNICLCPRSNHALHGRLPDIPGMAAAGLKPALGTDSLASTPTLSLWDEMAFTAQHFPQLDPDLILAMATLWGAAAAGRPELGHLEPGAGAAMVYLDLNAADDRQAAEAAVNHGFSRLEAI